MAIRIRTVGGIRVALCAAETDPQPGDVYLDDAEHYALSAKFQRDFREMAPHAGGAERLLSTEYPDEWAAMDTQKKRDAVETLNAWIAAGMPDNWAPP